MSYKLLLFDLDGTLLRSDKTISEYTIKILQKCRSEKNLLIGVATSRSEKNAMQFISELCPDIIISSGGALVKLKEENIYAANFSVEEIQTMIKRVRDICGKDCEITIDTIAEHYWNYKSDPRETDPSWGESVYTDFTDFAKEALKMCVEIEKPDVAEKMRESCPDCDCVKFSDGNWYKFTKKGVTKENAILRLCDACNISVDEIIAFGDDLVDIGMLKLCGKGIAMGNAIDEVKEIADCIIGNNDEDGIADYLAKNYHL